MTARFRYYTLDVFTDRLMGGNPLAVIPEAKGLDASQMQAVASEFNLSETVFILPPRDPANLCALRIFTPKVELRFAGHPTVGTAHLLALLGQLPELPALHFETLAGRVAVYLHASDDALEVEIDAPVVPHLVPLDLQHNIAASILGLSEADLDPQLPVAASSAGEPLLFVPLRDVEALGRCQLDLAIWKTQLAGTPGAHVYPFVQRSRDDFRARMFAPQSGIAEDPATGGGALALAGYLAAYGGFASVTGRALWRIEQGIEMGRPSFLTLRAELQAGKLVRASVAGRAVQVMEGTINIPESLEA
jgi:trans-2,3-dihydro-3-hydroxyanthranilate isomerase